jgi:hypothetical protein
MGSKITKAVLMLSKETIHNNIAWEVAQTDTINLDANEKVNGSVYITESNGEKLRLYKFIGKYFTDYDKFKPYDDVRLEMIDNYGNTKWKFPKDEAIIALYNTVQEKTSGASEFLKRLLKEE